MTSQTTPESTLGSIAQGEAPVLERLVAMNLDSLENSGLDLKTYFLARLAALVAMDAAPVSYLMNLGLAADAGVTVEEVQGTLIAIAPVVGSARVASASGKILRAAFGVAVAEAEGTVPEQRKA
ncbi:carboxymuconolactone decarboxylase family protein [Nocardioides sp. WL0053]|uniref:Carboxymuconolactone decarboxylase family protein n=1 Tax=Nocardioides jiangsuensis TaxID=2866161 RepID=A0ABS7RGM7_9ACTN|nr:carboxymuconolactone decarboxylase family protein [Nocardioides jiangsuensis]MBY9074195.1 carboxymuconolactone decarboxylase family protein [Nocardioides jiangsuensis]